MFEFNLFSDTGKWTKLLFSSLFLLKYKYYLRKNNITNLFDAYSQFYTVIYFKY